MMDLSDDSSPYLRGLSTILRSLDETSEKLTKTRGLGEVGRERELQKDLLRILRSAAENYCLSLPELALNMKDGLTHRCVIEVVCCSRSSFASVEEEKWLKKFLLRCMREDRLEMLAESVGWSTAFPMLSEWYGKRVSNQFTKSFSKMIKEQGCVPEEVFSIYMRGSLPKSLFSCVPQLSSARVKMMGRMHIPVDDKSWIEVGGMFHESIGSIELPKEAILEAWVEAAHAFKRESPERWLSKKGIVLSGEHDTTAKKVVQALVLLSENKDKIDEAKAAFAAAELSLVAKTPEKERARPRL